jgi:hypothetical protein
VVTESWSQRSAGRSVVASPDGLGKRSVGTPFYVGRSGQSPAAKDLPSAFVQGADIGAARERSFDRLQGRSEMRFCWHRYPTRCRRDCPQVSCNCLDRAQAIHVFGMRGITSDSRPDGENDQQRCWLNTPVRARSHRVKRRKSALQPGRCRTPRPQSQLDRTQELTWLGHLWPRRPLSK